MWKSAVVEHQWDQVDWDGTRVLERAARPVQLKVKEALYIERTDASTSAPDFCFIFALRMTRASSRNVSKFYQTVKLSTKNLRLFHAASN